MKVKSGGRPYHCSAENAVIQTEITSNWEVFSNISLAKNVLSNLNNGQAYVEKLRRWKKDVSQDLFTWDKVVNFLLA